MSRAATNVADADGDLGGPVFGLRDAALYLAIIIFWGTSWIALRGQLGVVAPEVSVLWRFMAATVMIWVIALVRRERLAFSVRDHVVFAPMGCGMFGLNFLCFYYAGLYVASGLLAVMFSLASIVNVVLAAVLTRRLPRPRLAIGALMGATGVTLMYLPQLSVGVGGGLGLMFGALGTLCFCIGNLASVVVRRRGASLVSSSAWGFVYGAIAIFIVCLARGATFTIGTTPIYLLTFAWLAGPCSIGALLVYLALVNRIGMARASYATVLFPIVALTISTFAESYAWNWLAIAGVVVALGGNLVMQARPR